MSIQHIQHIQHIHRTAVQHIHRTSPYNTPQVHPSRPQLRWCARPTEARGVRHEARRSDGSQDWGAEQRASAAAGPTGEPGDAGGRVGVAFVGVCSAAVPNRAAFLRVSSHGDGTAEGWGADYKQLVMLQSPTPALTPPRIARAPRRRVARGGRRGAPRGGAGDAGARRDRDAREPADTGQPPGLELRPRRKRREPSAHASGQAAAGEQERGRRLRIILAPEGRAARRCA